LIAGRKLLLADDSAAVQKVIELTFADEGMEVVAVRDGQAALEKLEYLAPDVVLADAFMPGLNGYDLCRSMKADDRFSRIPVMLLISSFAPFDEAEAQRAGADDIITKPFQSIRQLVSRVDSLISGRQLPGGQGSNQPMDDANQPDADVPIPVQIEHDEPNVTVLVEAAQMETALPHGEHGGLCAPDIEFQTADTARLEAATRPVDVEDTIEIEPQFEAPEYQRAEVAPAGDLFEYANNMNINQSLPPNEPRRPQMNDALLDLDDNDFAASAIDDDVVLDLDEPEAASYDAHSWSDESSVNAAESVEPLTDPVISPEPEVESSLVVEAAPEANAQFEEVTATPGLTVADQQLSADAIEAIARRVIEQMSDRVVREIAWEVVPELSELMIKKKLEER